MTKDKFTRQILNLRNEHKKPIGIALTFPEWAELNKELHQIQHVEDAFLEYLVASRFMGLQVFLKAAGEPEFLFYDPADVDIYKVKRVGL